MACLRRSQWSPKTFSHYNKAKQAPHAGSTCCVPRLSAAWLLAAHLTLGGASACLATTLERPVQPLHCSAVGLAPFHNDSFHNSCGNPC